MLPHLQGWDCVKDVQDIKNRKKDKATETEANRSMRARQRAIGRELRRFYDGVAEEPVPDDFLNLLQRIEGDGSRHEEDDKTS